MKKVLFSLSLLVAGSTAFAQVNKGQWLAGGNITFQSSKIADADDDSRVTTFELSPNAGYFFMNQLAGGLRVDLKSEKVKGFDDGETAFIIAPFARYYFLPAAQKVNVFGDLSYGFGSHNEGGESRGLNKFSIMAGPALFLTPNTALEFAVGYQSLGGEAYETGEDNDVKRENTIGFKVGFQIHLGNAKK